MSVSGISATSAYESLSAVSSRRNRGQSAIDTAPASFAGNGSVVQEISAEARALMAVEQSIKAAAAGSSSGGASAGGVNSQSTQSDEGVDMGEYFSQKLPKDANGQTLILLPSQSNVAALKAHVSKTFSGFLASHNIPQAPSSISYDSEGKVQLPADYPYADQLKQALADDRSMSDALSALSSWGSFQADAERMAPFYAEAASAKSPQELEAIAKKYQSVIGSGRTAMVVSLSFDAKGNVSLKTNS